MSVNFVQTPEDASKYYGRCIGILKNQIIYADRFRYYTANTVELSYYPVINNNVDTIAGRFTALIKLDELNDIFVLPNIGFYNDYDAISLVSRSKKVADNKYKKGAPIQYFKETRALPEITYYHSLRGVPNDTAIYRIMEHHRDNYVNRFTKPNEAVKSILTGVNEARAISADFAITLGTVFTEASDERFKCIMLISSWEEVMGVYNTKLGKFVIDNEDNIGLLTKLGVRCYGA